MGKLPSEERLTSDTSEARVKAKSGDIRAWASHHPWQAAATAALLLSMVAIVVTLPVLELHRGTSGNHMDSNSSSNSSNSGSGSSTSDSMKARLSVGLALPMKSYTQELHEQLLSIIGGISDSPAGFGPLCSDRAAWNATVFVNSSAGRYTLSRAKAATFPAFSDEAYLAYRFNGSRIGDSMLNARISYVSLLALAECVEYKGIYVQQLAAALMSIALQRSWSLPSHDPQLDYYNGTTFFVELSSSQYAAELGQVIYALGHKLPVAVTAAVMYALEQRVFEPMRAAYNGTDEALVHMRWLVGPKYNNWNAVCLSGVTTAALAVLPDKTERALFITGDMLHSKFFTSFTADGYDTEGASYFGYAVMNSIRDREIILQHTRGTLDTFNSRVVARALLFALEFPMNSNSRPCSLCTNSVASFGDNESTLPTPIVQYIGNVLLNQSNTFSSNLIAGAAGQTMSWWLTPDRTARLSFPDVTTTRGVYALRKYYNRTCVLVSRPDADNTGRGVAMTVKLLGNGYSHSHNDVGSYAITLKSVTLTGDPGGPGEYDADSFGSKRYRQPIFNSYGHPVPRVAGQNQVDADDAQTQQRGPLPQMVGVTFSDAADTVSMNLTAAYKVSTLRLLMRNVTLVRTPTNYVTIHDSVSMSRPAAFETALITLYNHTIYPPSGVCFSAWPSLERLCVNITASHAFNVSAELLRVASNPQKTFTRVAIRLTPAVTQAWIRTVVHDARSPPVLPAL